MHKRMYLFFTYLFISVASIFCMEKQKEFSFDSIGVPEEIQMTIWLFQREDVHNQITTAQEARDYIVSNSLVTKESYDFFNNPHTVKKYMSNLARKLDVYEETIAQKLSFPAATLYIQLHDRFFNKYLTKDDVEQLLKKGADPNYRRKATEHPQWPQPYARERHEFTGNPLVFYATGTTDIDYDIVKCLLDYGASLAIEANGFRPLQLPIFSASAKITALLLHYDTMNKKNNYNAEGEK